MEEVALVGEIKLLEDAVVGNVTSSDGWCRTLLTLEVVVRHVCNKGLEVGCVHETEELEDGGCCVGLVFS